MTIPTPVVMPRNVNDKIKKMAIQEGLHPILAKIIASRDIPKDIESIKDYLQPKLSILENPSLMTDVNKAALRIVKAILSKEIIALETDHDCDGQTSNAVLYHNLINRFKHPKDKIKVYIGHRLKEGYGLSQKVAERILKDKPSLVITADNGSSDEPRIAFLKNHGIDVIVTDHHQIPKEGVPKSAYAVVNPTREKSDYKDDLIAGCMVAWLLMTVVRKQLVQIGFLKKDENSLRDSLDFVAVGTIADCVSMSRSYNNRAVVHYGLSLINQGIKPCWRVIKQKLKREITTQDLGFVIGPLLNSDGRLSSALRSVSFLLAENDNDARAWLKVLEEQNQERKSVQKDIVDKGIDIAKVKVSEKKAVLCIFLEDGHSGVHGIAASRIKDMFGRPTVFLTPKKTDENVITGSLRSIDDFHIQKALQLVDENYPGLILSYGGHQGAAGVSFERKNLEKFINVFEIVCEQLLYKKNLNPVIYVDSELQGKDVNHLLFNELKKLEPFGREFEEPIFLVTGFITNIKLLSDNKHMKIDIMLDDNLITGIWFNYINDFEEGDVIKAACMLKENNFQNKKNIEIQIVYAEIL